MNPEAPSESEAIRVSCGLYVDETGTIYKMRHCQFVRMHQQLDSRGYFRVWYRREGYYVHQLVAEAFYGPRPPDQLVRHLNDVKTDNRPENLAYGTRRENLMDARRNGIMGAAKLTDQQVRDIFELSAAGESGRSLAKLFGVTESTISFALNRRSYAHVPIPPHIEKAVVNRPGRRFASSCQPALREVA